MQFQKVTLAEFLLQKGHLKVTLKRKSTYRKTVSA